MNNTSYMKQTALLLILIIMSSTSEELASAKDALKPDPTLWCLVTKDGVEARSKPNDKKTVSKLRRGALLPGYATKNSDKQEWVQIATVDLDRMTPVSGWVKSSEVEIKAANEFPVDDKVLVASGRPFVEDFAAENTAIARFLVGSREAGPVMVCYLGTEVLSHTRMQVFYQSKGRLKAGPSIDLPFAEMKSPITRIEARDLVGGGDECLITHEPYSAGPQNSGIRLVVRRLEANNFKVVAKIPISAHNFASFPPRLEILEPDEANIGRPGTDTKGEIEFVARDSRTIIVWKGEINFHALGRERPLETLTVEKLWSWDGQQFSPRP